MPLPATKPELAAHCRRAAAVAADLSRRLGLPPRDQQIVREAAILHHHPPELLDLNVLDGFLGEAWKRCGVPMRVIDPADRRYRQDLLSVLVTFHSGSARVTDQRISTLADLLTAANLFAEALEVPAPASDARCRVMTTLRIRAEEGLCRPGVVKSLERLPDIRIEDLLEVVHGLPVYAAVALKVLALAAASDVSFQKLESLVSADQVLTGRLIAVANSWAYSPMQSISSIRSAISYIGIEVTRKVVTAASFQPLFASASFRDLWKHSLEVARLCEHLAGPAHISSEEAFLAGLVHDVGRVAILKLPGDAGAACARLVEEGCEPVFAERFLFGFSHAEGGAVVLRHWSFSDRLVDAVRHHHTPDAGRSDLAALVYLAESRSSPQESVRSEPQFGDALARLGASPDTFAELDPEIGLLESLVGAT